MNVYKHRQNCETVAAVTVAKWNCYEQTGIQSPRVHLLTGTQSQQFNFSSRMHHRINITAMICKYRYVPVIQKWELDEHHDGLRHSSKIFAQNFSLLGEFWPFSMVCSILSIS